MADGKLYQFQAGGEACGVCSGMDGQISEGGMGLPHDGCMCQVVPVGTDDDCPTYDYQHAGTERYGPRGASARIYFEVTVTCCDGSEIGETLEIDMGEEPGGRSLDEEIAQWDSEIDGAAQELAEGCPEEDSDFNCC